MIAALQWFCFGAPRFKSGFVLFFKSNFQGVNAIVCSSVGTWEVEGKNELPSERRLLCSHRSGIS